MLRNASPRAALAAVFLLLASGASALDLYVAPNGNDAWSGASKSPTSDGADGPLASLAGARDRIRELRKGGLNEAALVRVQAGEYKLSEPFVLSPEDSGSLGAPVVYAAEEGAAPVFSGGSAIDGWRADPDGKWSAATPLKFNQLFVNGERRARARTPNADAADPFFHVAGRVAEPKDNAENNRAFKFAPGDIKDWNDPEANVVAIHSWEASRHRIASVDEAAAVVKFTGAAHWPFTQWDESQRYYVENTADALDAPGEWRLDAGAGRVHYIPLPGERLESCSFVAPQAKQFLKLEGDPAAGKFVEHVTISGLAFRFADWTLPEDGYHDPQAASSIAAVVEMVGARRVAFERCEIAHIGTYAMRIKRGSRDVRVERNHIHDLGAGGVCVGEMSIPKDESEAVSHVALRNNYLHDGGNVYESAVGVWIGQSPDNTVANNEISDFGYTGVSVGWTWGYAENASHRNAIEFNRIHHIGSGALSDMGGIYTLGNAVGTVLRHNHIHHVYSHHYGGWGIYPDEGTSNELIEFNIVHHCKTGGFHQHYGKENVVRNNVFAFAIDPQIARTREEEHRSFRFERNIVVYDSGELLGSNWSNGRFFNDWNIYWRTDGEPPTFKGKSLEEWRAATGMDLNSRAVDPLFVDAAAGDFRLRADSPAFAMGIRPIDARAIGLVGEQAWRELPSKFPKRKQKWPAKGN